MKTVLAIIAFSVLASCSKVDVPRLAKTWQWQSTAVLQQNVVYLNFDSSRLSHAHIIAILQEVQNDFRQFQNLTFTVDRNDFLKRPIGQRQEVLIIDSLPPYSNDVTYTLPDGTKYRSNPAGLAVVNSMFMTLYEWSAKVFTHKLHYSARSIAPVISHEVGHAMGLQHFPNSMGPAVMSEGRLWDESAKWTTGYSVYKQFQDDTAIINTNLRRAGASTVVIPDRLTWRINPVICIK